VFFFKFIAKNRFAVCPVPMNKEQEEMIKEQERNLKKEWFATCKGIRFRNREIFACGIRIT